MRVVIFFTFLCFLLTGGDKYVSTGTHHNCSRYSPAENTDIGQQLKSTNTNPDFTVIEVVGVDNEEEYVISDDVDDEDANNSLARKYKLVDRCYLTVSSPFYLCKYFKAPPPLGTPLSCIHITQRVLRI